jgi:hypothetical protein
MNNKKTRKLEDYLRQGKVICGSADSLGEGERLITTMVCIRKVNDNLFEVDIEVFFADIDIRELNLREELKCFPNLEEAIYFMECETNVKFAQMHA